MEIFINEVSLQGQYFSDVDFSEAVQAFTAIFFLINERLKKPRMYKSEVLLNFHVIRQEAFQASFNKISNRQLKTAFRNIVFNKLNPRDWQVERQHSSDDLFAVGADVVTDTSIAELAERRLQDTELCGLLVNFICSRFADSTSMEIIKNEQIHIEVACVDNRAAMQNWLDANTPPVYSAASTSPPQDEQTILRDTTRFKKTSRTPVQGRSVYLEKTTKRYWYVDNLHFGDAAQLEIFDAQGEHLGVASIEGVIDINRRVPGRKITI